MDTENQTEAGVVSDLTRRALAPQIVSHGGRTFLITQLDTKLKEITDPHDQVVEPPKVLQQNVIVQTVDSLVDYVNRFKTASTILLADMAANRILGLLDYHQPDLDAGKATGSDHKAAHVGHRVQMDLPFSVEWLLWTGINKKLMEQVAFAQFLEENGADVVAPAGADLLEVARDLHAKRKVDFRKAVRLSGDIERFEYQETTEAQTPGGIEVPTRFELGIPVYFGESPVKVFAFLRWKLVETNIVMGVELNRYEHVRQAVFKLIVTEAAERCGVPAVFGKLV